MQLSKVMGRVTKFAKEKIFKFKCPANGTPQRDPIIRAGWPVTRPTQRKRPLGNRFSNARTVPTAIFGSGQQPLYTLHFLWSIKISQYRQL